MQIHLALYDPSFTGSNRSYWTWRSSVIPDNLLEECYYSYLIKKKPEKPEQIRKSDLFGGIIKLQNWFVVYRFYNGGRDLRDRPGRYVILTGWIKRDDARNQAPNEIFSSSVFESFALTTPPCPVPKPGSLDIDFSGAPIKRQPVAINPFGKYEFPIGTTVASAVEKFFGLNDQSNLFQLTINKTDNINHLVIEKIKTDTQNSFQTIDQQDLPFEPQIRSDEFEQANNSDVLFQKEDNMNYSQINLFNTCALIVIIIFLSALFVQQLSIQKQINNNSELINTIQQKLDALHPEQGNFYYNPVQNPQNNVFPESAQQGQVWDNSLDSTELNYPQTLPHKNQFSDPSDLDNPSSMSLPDKNESAPEQTPKKDKKKKGVWNILLK